MNQHTPRAQADNRSYEQGPAASAHDDPSSPISKVEFESIAAFRYTMRKFLRFSEQAARQERITPQQHQLLLQLKGYPSRDYATVSELADRLQMRQHSMVGLIDRTEAQGLVRREPGTVDRRQVFVHLTAAGEHMLHRLAMQHRRELITMRDALRLPV
jgi:DNA-binding MarR family transcriptional regulator